MDDDDDFLYGGGSAPPHTPGKGAWRAQLKGHTDREN
jgi:hypothetical protein